MNVLIIMNGQDVTDSCLLSATRIAFDSSKRITTAQITVMGDALQSVAGAAYDAAHYDVDRYAVSLSEMYEVQILDGRDGTTKLFDGQIYSMTMVQSDAAQFSVFYQCDLNDWAAYLDRSVCWDTSFAVTMPNSDQGIINALLGHFCPKIHLTDVAQIVPTIQKYDWATKTCRQVLDDMSSISMGSWRVDFDGNLHYHLATAAPTAPFGLSTSPDMVTTFPVKVDGYKHDFTNPVNHAYVRGTQDPTTGVTISASYSDPVSVQTYGDYSTGIVDTQIVTGWDAALRAKSIVLTYAYPIETGTFTIWGKDGLQCGMSVHILEENIGIDDDYLIRAMTMQWVDKSTVVYTCQFGAVQQDLETILRLLDQRTKWATSNVPVTVSTPGPPPDGSVTDASIAPPGLTATSIQSVNAGSINGKIQANQIGGVDAGVINGKITAGQIQTVNASSIQGQIQANQIYQVNAGQINGSIQAGQIGGVNAGVINGVIVSTQLADQIIDNLSKYAAALTPIQMIKIGDPWPVAMPNKNFPPNSFFYYEPDGNFYQINAAGTGWAVNNNPTAALMSFYHIGAINARSITGLILAAQINTITAGQITGSIQASQIGGVNASVIAGPIEANQIHTVNATAIQGLVQANQIKEITAGQITGTIAAAQIGTITAGQITGTLAYNQIGSINAATITVNQVGDAQISGMNGGKITAGTITSAQLNATAIDVGDPTGVGSMPARIRVWASGAVVSQIGYMGEVGVGAYGGWFKIWGAGGTSYSNAPVFTDSAGNLTIRNTNLTNANLSGGTLTNSTISNPSISVSGQIKTDTQTFDATYSTLAFVNTSGSDQANFISRGLVLYYNSGKIGSIVRSPSGGWMEMEFPVGGAYVFISGNQGVRSDAGYSVGGTRVINSSGQFTGTVTGNLTGTCSGTLTGNVNTSGSIVTSNTVNASGGYFGGSFQGSSVSTSGSVSASQGFYVGSQVINSSGQFIGNGVNCNAGIGGTGFNPTGWSGQTWNISFRDHTTGALMDLWINGQNFGAIQIRFVGGVIVGTA
jgi:hypothetical protein